MGVGKKWLFEFLGAMPPKMSWMGIKIGMGFAPLGAKKI